MSVSELVKSREGLIVQIKEIDGILKQAVDAYGSPLPSMPRPNNQQLSATPVPQEGRSPDNILFGNGYKPPITPMNPVVPQQQGTGYPGTPLDQNQAVQPVRQDPRSPFAGDVQSGFTLFDTDSYVAEQNALSMQAQTEYDVDSMNDEISSLKQQISEGIENVRDSETTGGDGKKDVSSAA